VLSSLNLFQANNWLDIRWGSNNWMSLNVLSEPGIEGINISSITTVVPVEL